MPSSLDDEKKLVTKVTLVGSLLDLVLGLLKIIFGIVSNSYALVTDGVHSLSDLLSDAFVLFIARFSRDKPDQEHPYGHGRFETLGTIILGIILFIISGIIMFDAYRRLLQVDPLQTPGIATLVIAVMSIGSKEWIYRYTAAAASKLSSSLLLANAWHSRSDAMSSIAVLIGISGAMLGFAWMDLAAAMVVALMIAWIAYKLMKDSMEELVDTAVPRKKMRAIENYIRDFEGAIDWHNLRSRKHGGKILLDVHLRVPGRVSVSEGHYLAEKLAHNLKQKFLEISDVVVHIDPEEDKDPSQLVKLPGRPDVLAKLHDLAEQAQFSLAGSSINLHYLNNIIEIEIFVDKSIYNNDLEQLIKEKCKAYPWLGKITFYVIS